MIFSYPSSSSDPASSGSPLPESQSSTIPFPTSGAFNFMLAKTRVTITGGGRYLELKARCEPASPSALSAIGVKSLRERVCKDPRRLWGESIRLARIEGGSSSASLGGEE